MVPVESQQSMKRCVVVGVVIAIAHAITIQGQVISAGGGTQPIFPAVVAGTRWVEPQLAAGPMGIESIIQRSPELFEFLRCDAILADVGMQQMMNLQCARMRGQ